MDGRNGDKNESRNPIYILRQCRTLPDGSGLRTNRDKYGRGVEAHIVRDSLCVVTALFGEEICVHGPPRFSLMVTKSKLPTRRTPMAPSHFWGESGRNSKFKLRFVFQIRASFMQPGTERPLLVKSAKQTLHYGSGIPTEELIAIS